MTGRVHVTDPAVQHLSQLLAQVAEGDLAVPPFHRDFVWSDGQRLDLLRSVLEGLPIGCLLTWRTTARLAGPARLGPHRLKSADGRPTRLYLLDGRLSTLYGALAPGARDLHYDLELGDFVVGGEARGSRLPLRLLLDGPGLLRFQREVLDESLVSASDAVARRFRERTVPVVSLVTDDLELATRAFRRAHGL